MNTELKAKLDSLFENDRVDNYMIRSWVDLCNVFERAQAIVWSFPMEQADVIVTPLLIENDPDRVLAAQAYPLQVIAMANNCYAWVENSSYRLHGRPDNIERVNYLYQRYTEICAEMFEVTYLVTHPGEQEVTWENVTSEGGAMHKFVAHLDYHLAIRYAEIVHSECNRHAVRYAEEYATGYESELARA